MPHNRTNTGFTLIELSIVLVIIGLIVGGVLAGQQLIYAAKVRKIGTDLQKYDLAVLAFKDKYDGLPGNITNATTILAPADPKGCPLAGGGDSGTRNTTCDGGGSGSIGGNYDWNANASAFGEVFHVFEQLSLAHMIEGSYVHDQYGPGPDYPSMGMSYSGGVVCLLYDPAAQVGNTSLQGSGSPLTAGRHIFALYTGVCGNYGGNMRGSFTPVEAYAIDLKFDDGLPQGGNIVASQFGCSNPGYGNNNAYLNLNLGIGSGGPGGAWGAAYGCSLYKRASF